MCVGCLWRSVVGRSFGACGYWGKEGRRGDRGIGRGARLLNGESEDAWHGRPWWWPAMLCLRCMEERALHWGGEKSSTGRWTTALATALFVDPRRSDVQMSNGASCDHGWMDESSYVAGDSLRGKYRADILYTRQSIRVLISAVYGASEPTRPRASMDIGHARLKFAEVKGIRKHYWT